MKNIISIVVMMFFFCIAANAQEKIYMPYFEVINMHSDYQTSSTRLLKTYIELENKSELVLPKKDTSLFSETKEQALEKAKSLNISHVLIGELNRMGETVIVSVTLYKTETGEK
jgi:TolB-like protein